MSPDARKLKLVLPKGRLQEKVIALLSAVGVDLTFSSRSYRPLSSDPDIEVKLLKPQNIPSLVALGRHDAGFAGFDWVLENGLKDSPDIVELLDLAYDKVRLIAAVPDTLAENDAWRKMKLVVATEYTRIAERYIAEKKLDAVLIKSFGATEALPPEDADLIVDNTSTGSTLAVNRLTIVDEILTSTTRFLASGEAMKDEWKKEKLSQLVMLMQSKLNANQKVLLEMNVSKDDFEKLVAQLPAMRSPTVSPLYGADGGFAVKVAVPTKEVSKLIPKLIARGARDVLEYRLEKIIV
ncbi:MAG: ATP phosphoribosyltransferase [Vampirovibrionales bacterium]|nr:ATP phosphoribosyltransferase [Vampirovibrionales bacterium]